MIQTALSYIRADLLAQALLPKLRECSHEQARDLKKELVQYDIQCKEWDRKRTRRVKPEQAESAGDTTEPMPELGGV